MMIMRRRRRRRRRTTTYCEYLQEVRLQYMYIYIYIWVVMRNNFYYRVQRGDITAASDQKIPHFIRIYTNKFEVGRKVFDVD